MGVFTFTKNSNAFEITVSERRARILQDTAFPAGNAAAPAGNADTVVPAGNETYPEQMALHLGNQAVVFFTVIILLVALLLSVRFASEFPRLQFYSCLLWIDWRCCCIGFLRRLYYSPYTCPLLYS